MRSVTVHDLKTVLDAGSTVVIDVREPSEYAAGHVPGAQPMPLTTVPQPVGELPTDRPVYLVCAVGARSGQAAAFLPRRASTRSTSTAAPATGSRPGYPVER